MAETKSMKTTDHEVKSKADAKPADIKPAYAAAPKTAAVAAKAVNDDPKSTPEEAKPKAAKPGATGPAPYPSQADLNAIKEGNFRRNRQVVSEASEAAYKTR